MVVRADNLMVTIDCPPQILVVLDNRKGLIFNADCVKFAISGDNLGGLKFYIFYLGNLSYSTSKNKS